MTNQKAVNIFDLGDLSTPWCLRVVVTLKIVELISEGTTNLANLAKKTGTNPRMLVLVLRTLVAKGIFEEPGLKQFTMNTASEALKSQEARFEYDLHGLGRKMTDVWSTLLKFVQTGESYYPDLFGKTFWEDLDANPDLSKEFNISWDQLDTVSPMQILK